MIEHPHIHVIIPGGGLTGGGTWKACRDKFLFPVSVMRKMYRGKVMDFFTQAVKQGGIKLCGALAKYEDPEVFKNLINELYAKEWVVYVKPPFVTTVLQAC